MIVITPLNKKPQIRVQQQRSRCQQVKSLNLSSSPKSKIYKISLIKKTPKNHKLHCITKVDRFKKVTDPIIQLVKALQMQVLNKKVKQDYQTILNQQVCLILKNDEQAKVSLGQIFQIYCINNKTKIQKWINGGCSALSQIKPFIKMYLQLKKCINTPSLNLSMDKSKFQITLKSYFQDQKQRQQKVSQKWRKRCFSDLADIYQQLFQRYESMPLDVSEFEYLKQKVTELQEVEKSKQPGQDTVLQCKSKKDIMFCQDFIKMKFYDNLKTQIRQLAKETYKIIND